MPTPFESRLVTALRSGSYAQAYRHLQTTAGFCCLGVACDLHDPTLWDSWVLGNGFERPYNSHSSVLTPDVQAALGWATDDGRLTFKSPFGKALSLTILNDEGFTFSQIADVIAAGLVA